MPIFELGLDKNLVTFAPVQDYSGPVVNLVYMYMYLRISTSCLREEVEGPGVGVAVGGAEGVAEGGAGM